MLSFIKVFFQGILYVLISPILLIILVLNLIYAILIFFLYEFKSIFLFFKGVSYKSMDDETRTLKEIKNQLNNVNNINQNLQPVDSEVNNNV